MKKSLGAAIALQRNIDKVKRFSWHLALATCILALNFAKSLAANPAEPPAATSGPTPPASATAGSTATCSDIAWEGAKSVPAIPQNFDQTIKQMVSDLREQKVSGLLGSFHPRLRIKQEFADQLFAKLEMVSKGPFDVSVMRIWQIRDAEGKANRAQCSDMGIFSIYGFPEQLAVMFQIMGQKELSHFLAIFVPTDKGWKIGASQYLQRTHTGKNAEMWYAEGVKDAVGGNKILAFSKFEIAQRLMGDRRYLDDPNLETIQKQENATLSPDDWRKAITETIAPLAPIQRANTILAKDGVGILLVIGLKKEQSLNTLRTLCQSIGRDLSKQKWFDGFQAIKCSFSLPGEKVGEEGQLGGLYLARADWQKP